MVAETVTFHTRTKGSWAEKEDWWRLIIDGTQLTVEHEWSHTDAYKGSGSNEGRVSYSVKEFLEVADANPQAKEALKSLLQERKLSA